MDNLEKLKQEISAMSLDEFMTHFIVGAGMKDYVCADIRVPAAHCKNTDYICNDCILEYLKSEAKK